MLLIITWVSGVGVCQCKGDPQLTLGCPLSPLVFQQQQQHQQNQQHQQQQQMYIAQVLQDPNSDEPGGGSGGEEDRGSSQDEEMLNGGNSINEADFQSGEDSLIANEVRQ